MATTTLCPTDLDGLARIDEDAAQDVLLRLLAAGRIIGDPCDGRVLLVDDPSANDAGHVMARLRIGVRQQARRRRHQTGRCDPRPPAREGTVIDLDALFSSMTLPALLGVLPMPDRRLLVLRYAAGWSFVEIADELGVRPESVRQRHGRLIDRLRREQLVDLET